MPRSLLLLSVCVIPAVLPQRPLLLLANEITATPGGTRNGDIILARCTGAAPGAVFISVRCSVGPLTYHGVGTTTGEARGVWVDSGQVTVCATVMAAMPGGGLPQKTACAPIPAAGKGGGEDPPPP